MSHLPSSRPAPLQVRFFPHHGAALLFVRTLSATVLPYAPRFYASGLVMSLRRATSAFIAARRPFVLQPHPSDVLSQRYIDETAAPEFPPARGDSCHRQRRHVYTSFEDMPEQMRTGL